MRPGEGGRSAQQSVQGSTFLFPKPTAVRIKTLVVNLFPAVNILSRQFIRYTYRSYI